MATSAGLARLRRAALDMLIADRKAALQQRNASAAITASSRIADLLLRQAEEEAAKAQPITQITHVIVHQAICPICKEHGAICDTPPPPEPEVSRLQRGASGWDDPDPAPHADPAPPAPVRQPDTIQVPKLPRTDRRRDRDNPVVKGLA